MTIVTFTRGMQGSGKSTWAKKFCVENPNYVRISRDDLRHMRGKYWMPKHEGFITKWEFALIGLAIKNGYNLVIDEMNLNPKSVQAIKDFCKTVTPDVEFRFKDFTDVPLETCIERDKARPNSIGEKVLRETYNKYIAPKIEQHKHKEGLPHAIIVDLDGTLALFNDKNPYDRDFINDEVNKAVLCVVKAYLRDPNRQLIIFSGRSDRFKDQTIQWLAKYGIFPDVFEMRTHEEEKAHIKDVIVKKKMYDTFIDGKFNIDFVLDDRPQVCRLWYSLGLPLLKVGDPDAEF